MSTWFWPVLSSLPSSSLQWLSASEGRGREIVSVSLKRSIRCTRWCRSTKVSLATVIVSRISRCHLSKNNLSVITNRKALLASSYRVHAPVDLWVEIKVPPNPLRKTRIRQKRHRYQVEMFSSVHQTLPRGNLLGRKAAVLNRLAS